MLFVVVLFIFKTTSFFQNSEVYQRVTQENGLNYNSNTTIVDLVNKDTDGDGVPDWQEGLYGLDPTKKETTPGIPDSVAMAKLKATQANTTTMTKETNPGTENLTQTDKFSRELFATMAAANQSGSMDQNAVDALSTALAEKIQNPVIRKVFLASDIKISVKDDKEAVMTYRNALNSIQNIYTINYSAMDVLQKFVGDGNNANISALTELDPIILQTNKVIATGLKTSVPKSLSTLHLNVANSLERLVENLEDIKLFDTDTIVAFSAISQYSNNATALESDINNLQNAIQQKLSN